MSESHSSSFYNELRVKKSRTPKQPPTGAVQYVKFEKIVAALDEQLRKLGHKTRKPGGSGGILSASNGLRKSLGRFREFFRNNARQLYPGDAEVFLVPRRSADMNPTTLAQRSPNHRVLQMQASEAPQADYSSLDCVRSFSKDLKTLFDCFGQFSDFEDELSGLSAIITVINRWVSSLQGFENDLHTLAVQRYLFDSMSDISVYLDTLASTAVPALIRIGLPTVQASQVYHRSNLENQTIVAALFAGIATGMLQILPLAAADPSDDATIVLWYISLIFSVGSAMNGLLGLSWLHALHRTPDDRIPGWVLVWIKHFPLIFLILAVTCSFVALIIFAFAHLQNHATVVITIFLSSVSCFGWLTSQFILFTHNRDRGTRALRQVRVNLKQYVMSFKARFYGRNGANESASLSESAGDLPFEIDVPTSIGFRPANRMHKSRDSFWLAVDKEAMSIGERAKYRWHEATRRVIQQAQQKERRPPPPHSRFAHLIGAPNSHPESIEKLKHMRPSLSYHVNECHLSLVRLLQFSPNGGYLVSSSLDFESFLLRINRPVLCERVIDLSSSHVGHVQQIDWSPDGHKLLTRSNRTLTIWKLDMNDKGVLSRQVNPIMAWSAGSDQDASQTFQRATWNGDGKAVFLSKGHRMLKINVQDHVFDAKPVILDAFAPQPSEIRVFCVTSDSKWMICFGKYSKDEHKYHYIYCIFIWNLTSNKVARVVPVYHNASHIALASDDTSILTSYVNKSPSQLWRLQRRELDTNIVLRHSYMPNDSNTAFAALPSIFGGERDHLVLRATMEGDIHVWAKDSASLIHCINAPTTFSGQITSFTWNRASECYMYAIGLHDGTVHICTQAGRDDDASS